MQSDDVKIDRRRQPRVAVKLGVTLSSESNFFVGFTNNVSEGGLFVATHDLLPIGEQVQLQFQLPKEEEPISVDAEVRWHRPIASARDGAPPGFGAQFVEIDDGDHRRLQEFVSSREPIFFPD